MHLSEGEADEQEREEREGVGDLLEIDLIRGEPSRCGRSGLLHGEGVEPDG